MHKETDTASLESHLALLNSSLAIAHTHLLIAHPPEVLGLGTWDQAVGRQDLAGGEDHGEPCREERRRSGALF